jgi:hypothetical protein
MALSRELLKNIGLSKLERKERKARKQKEYLKGHWNNPIIHKCVVCGKEEQFPSKEDIKYILGLIEKGKNNPRYYHEAYIYYAKLECKEILKCLFCYKTFCKDHLSEYEHKCKCKGFSLRMEEINRRGEIKIVVGIDRKTLLEVGSLNMVRQRPDGIDMKEEYD